MDKQKSHTPEGFTPPQKLERRNSSFFKLSEIKKVEELSQKELDTLSIFENKIGSKRYVTVEELAEIFEISEKTVRDWVYKETIPCERLGRRVRFNPFAIARWCAERN